MSEFLILNSEEKYEGNTRSLFKNIINHSINLKENKKSVGLRSIRFTNSYKLLFCEINFTFEIKNDKKIQESISTETICFLNDLKSYFRTWSSEIIYDFVDERINKIIKIYDSFFKKNLISIELYEHLRIKLEYIFKSDIVGENYRDNKEARQQMIEYIRKKIKQELDKVTDYLREETLIKKQQVKIQIFIDNSHDNWSKCKERIREEITTKKSLYLDYNNNNNTLHFKEILDIKSLEITTCLNKNYFQYDKNTNKILINTKLRLVLFNNLFVYTNITGSNSCDKQLPLKIININNNKFDEYVVFSYEIPSFLPIIKNNFNSIEIKIVNINNEYINFTTGSVICELEIK